MSKVHLSHICIVGTTYALMSVKFLLYSCPWIVTIQIVESKVQNHGEDWNYSQVKMQITRATREPVKHQSAYKAKQLLANTKDNNGRILI